MVQAEEELVFFFFFFPFLGDSVGAQSRVLGVLGLKI